MTVFSVNSLQSTVGSLGSWLLALGSNFQSTVGNLFIRLLTLSLQHSNIPYHYTFIPVTQLTSN